MSCDVVPIIFTMGHGRSTLPPCFVKILPPQCIDEIPAPPLLPPPRPRLPLQLSDEDLTEHSECQGGLNTEVGHGEWEESSQEEIEQEEAHQHGVPLGEVETSDDQIEMTQNQMYGVPNTVAESADRNQPNYQNIVFDISYSLDGVQGNSQNQIDQEARQHGVPMAVVETSNDGIEMTQNQMYGVPNTVAESADRNQHSYQNIVSDTL